MVFLSRLLFSEKRRHFIDKLRIYVRGGTGGLGLSKYGGIGGRGGHVYVVGDTNTSLKRIHKMFPEKRFIAESGHNSSSRILQGPPGEDTIIKCPLGVAVTTDDGIVLGELNKEGDKVLAAKGGEGGSPKHSFIGQKGHVHSVSLDLKLIADIGLLGFPNAGKSTLLKGLSKATPRIASYPFTTIEPKIGVLEYKDHRQISMADLPGLIEGAHMNVGMGHNFLKHVERTKLLLVIVDVLGFRLNPHSPLRSSFENVLLLNKELELYKEELVSKPCLLVINKIDIPTADVKLSELMQKLENMKENISSIEENMRPSNLFEFDDILTISAKQKVNLDKLKTRLRELLDYHSDIQMDIKSVNNSVLDISNTEHIGVNNV